MPVRMLRGVDYRVLGPVSALVEGHRVNLGGRKQRVVLAVLLLARGESVSSDRLAERIWGDEAPQGARHTVQAYVSELRKVLDDPIEWDGQGYRLEVEPHRVDSIVFEDLLQQSRIRIEQEPAEASTLLREALQLWHGRPFEDLDVPAFVLEASRLEELRLAALELRIEADLRMARHFEVLGELDSLTAEFPLREGFRAQQMVALYRAGRQAEALRAFTHLRNTLAEELGIDPSPRLQILEEQILNQDSRLALADDARAHRTVLLTDVTATSSGATTNEPLGPRGSYPELVSELIRSAEGTIVRATEDGVVSLMPSVDKAAEASLAMAELLGKERSFGVSTMRVAIDSGPGYQINGGYFGPTMDRCARLLGLAHGGQILLSNAAAQALSVSDEIGVVELGEHRLRGGGRPQPVFQLIGPGLRSDFPGLRVDAPVPPIARSGLETATVRGYELRELIGEGDFGSVYRAYQTAVAREVAIKAIHPEYSNVASFVARFEAEAQFVAQLEHPHIVPLYDYWRDPDGAYLVMPYLRGGSLTGPLRSGPWNSGPALHLLSDLSAALSYAHRHGVVHRDLKPENVLLDEEGNAYLADFGIAVRLTDQSGALRASSPAYASPEELRGDPPSVSNDIYSLGVLTYELLTGIRPTQGVVTSSIGLIRTDLPSAVADVLATATSDSPASRYERVEDFLRALKQAMGADVIGVAEDLTPPRAGGIRNPYKGLRAFQETDAGDFHGRDALKDELLEAIRAHRLVAVVGSSGSGKSSVVRAGLIPALRSGALPGSRGWLLTDMFPGSYPFEELEVALRRVAVEDPGSILEELRSGDRGLLRLVKRILPGDDSQLVLVIDQFEELFSMVDDHETRRLFIDALTALVTDGRGRVRVVVTLRADFLDRPLDYPAFGELLKQGLVTVTALDDEALALAIARPARGVGLELDPGLIGEIINDVRDEPGSLPLLQYALTEMFSRRHGLTMTIEGYRESGGVRGALATRAEEVYRGLPGRGQEIARQVFLRLVTVGEETDDTRRRVRQSELRSLDIDRPGLDAVLQQFAAHRLLTFDRDALTRSPTVEVAHEALIREWDTLRGWIEEQRESLTLHRRFAAAVNEWQNSGSGDEFLLSGGRLQQYEAWAAAISLKLTRDESDFLARSRAIEDRRRRRRGIWRWSAALLLAGIAGIALWQAQMATSEERQATARRLAGDSVIALDEDPERAILLALEAAYLFQNAGESVMPETIAALHQAVQTSRLELTIDDGHKVVDMSPDGAQLVVDTGNGFGIWDAVTGTRQVSIEGEEDNWQAEDALFSPDGSRIAVSYLESFDEGTGHLSIRASATGQEITRLGRHLTYVNDWSPDGTMVAGSEAVGIDDDTERGVVWDVTTGERTAVVGIPLVFIDDETVFIHQPGEDRFAFVDLPSGGETASLDTRMGEISPTIAQFPSFVHSGTDLVLRSEGGLEKWDLQSRTPMWTNAQGDWPLAVDTGTGMVASAGFEGEVWLHDPHDGSIVATLFGHTGVVTAGDFHPDGRRLVTVQQDGGTRVWDVTPAGPSEVGALAIDYAYGTLISPSGQAVAASLGLPDEDTFAYADLATGQPYWSIDQWDQWEFPAVINDGWTMVALVDSSGDGGVRDLVTGDPISSLPDCTSPRALSPDGSVLLVNGVDHNRRLPCTSSSVDRRSRVIETATGEELLDLGERDVSRAVFNPGGVLEPGRYLATRSLEFGVTPRPIEIFDLTTGDLIGRYTPEADSALDLRFDPTGRYLAGGTQNGRAFVLDLSAVVAGTPPEEALVFDRVVGSGGVTGVRLNAEGILATSAFGSLRLWNIHTGELLVDLAIDIELPPTAAFSPDGNILYYSDTDFAGNVLRKFHLDTQVLVDLAESRVSRGLTDDECRRYLDSSACDRRVTANR
jgi:DNA-binding SARP family transcriptional activator/WD40 repeat protein